MKPKLTEEQVAIQAAAQNFTRGEFSDELALTLQQQQRFPWKIYKKACELGFIGVTLPTSLGGQECGLLENVLVIEEFCKKDSGIGIALSLADIGSDIVSTVGSERQKETILPPITHGEAVSALICPEIGGEMDPDGNEFVISKSNNDQYLISGEKEFVINGSLANILIIYCRLCNEWNATSGLFVAVEREKHGMSVIDMQRPFGMRMLPWSKVVLNDVEITDGDILGMGGNPQNYLYETRKVNAVKRSAQGLGISEGAFEQALAYSKQREQFKKKIGTFQGIRHKLVDMYIKLQAMRSLIYNAALSYDERRLDLHDAITTMMFTDIATAEITYEAMQIFGGAGYMIEMPIEHFYRDARAIRTLWGGRRIPQKDLVAQTIIGEIS